MFARKLAICRRIGNSYDAALPLSGSSQLGQHTLGLPGRLFRRAADGIAGASMGVRGWHVRLAHIFVRAIQGRGTWPRPRLRPAGGPLGMATNSANRCTDSPGTRPRVAFRHNLRVFCRAAQFGNHVGRLVLAVAALLAR